MPATGNLAVAVSSRVVSVIVQLSVVQPFVGRSFFFVFGSVQDSTCFGSVPIVVSCSSVWAPPGVTGHPHLWGQGSACSFLMAMISRSSGLRKMLFQNTFRNSLYINQKYLLFSSFVSVMLWILKKKIFLQMFPYLYLYMEKHTSASMTAKCLQN